MPTHYGDSEPEPAPQTNSPAPEKKKREVKKLTDKQKLDLKKHMDKHKDLQDMTASQRKSHRMKMMSRMRQGMSIKKAHADIMN